MYKYQFLMQIFLLILAPSLISCTDETKVTINRMAQSANNTSSSENVIKDFDKLILISDILDLFNLGSVGRQWIQLSQKLTPGCQKDMTQYLYGLEKRKLWAIKSKLDFISK